jgi:hypothetical protein
MNKSRIVSVFSPTPRAAHIHSRRSLTFMVPDFSFYSRGLRRNEKPQPLAAGAVGTSCPWDEVSCLMVGSRHGRPLRQVDKVYITHGERQSRQPVASGDHGCRNASAFHYAYRPELHKAAPRVIVL